MKSTKESILEEFDKAPWHINHTIGELYRGCNCDIEEDCKDGMKQFISQSLDRYGEEKYQEGLEAGGAMLDFDSAIINAYKKEESENQLEDETKLINRFRD